MAEDDGEAWIVTVVVVTVAVIVLTGGVLLDAEVVDSVLMGVG